MIYKIDQYFCILGNNALNKKALNLVIKSNCQKYCSADSGSFIANKIYVPIQLKPAEHLIHLTSVSITPYLILQMIK